MRREQLAINSISTRQSTLPEALAAYKEAGFQQVEFALPLVKNWLALDHNVDEVRQLLAEQHLKAIGGFETHLVCFGNATEQQANHDALIANARLIHALGGGTMVVGTDGPERPSLQALETIASTLRELLPDLQGLQVNIALEFNWSPVVKSLLSALSIVEKVQHPALGILFDLAHYHCTSSKLEHLTERSVPWIKHVHLNDMRAKPGEFSDCNADRVLPGEGILDLKAILQALEKYGYDGYYSIEMFNNELWSLPAAEAARRCYQSLLPYCTS